MTDSFDGYEYNSQMNEIKVEHYDGTFASYTGFDSNSIFVRVGQTVYPQTKLGTLDLFNNSVYRLYFNVNYLNGYDFEAEAKKDLMSSSCINNLRPLFYSNSGGKVLSGHDKYTVECSEAVFLEELTRREKKNYYKNKLEYK